MDRGKKKPLHSNIEQERSMSHNAHEQLPSPRSSGKPSGATRDGRMRWATATAAAILTLGLTPAAQAAEGALDPSFGVTSTSPLACKVEGGIGIMTCDFAGLRDAFFGGKVLPDGRILAEVSLRLTIVRTRILRLRGSTASTAASTPLLGSVDPMGAMGSRRRNVPTSVDEVRDLALQDDDGQKKIVVVGRGSRRAATDVCSGALHGGRKARRRVCRPGDSDSPLPPPAVGRV